ncbi:MAG: hypothetical protein ACK4Z6_04050 [Candidatus Methylomirabilales bacterium]
MPSLSCWWPPTPSTASRWIGFWPYLRHLGIDVRVTIRDGSPHYPERVAQAFPAQELCTFHLKQDVVKELLAAVRAYRKSVPDPPKRPKGRPRAEAPPPPPDPKKEIWKARGLFVMNPETLKEREEQAQAAGRPSPTALLTRLGQEHPPLQTIRSCAEEVYAIFTQPATNNDAERAGRRFRKRQKAHYRLRVKALLQAVLQQELLAQKARWERSGQPVHRLQPKERLHPTQAKAA